MRRINWITLVVAGVITVAGTLTGTPAAMACGIDQMDVHVPAGGVTYTLAQGAGIGSTAVAEITSETQPLNGGGLPLWGQMVTASSRSYLGTARNLDPGFCSGSLWYNGGSFQQVELSVHKQYFSGVESIHATGFWTP